MYLQLIVLEGEKKSVNIYYNDLISFSTLLLLYSSAHPNVQRKEIFFYYPGKKSIFFWIKGFVNFLIFFFRRKVFSSIFFSIAIFTFSGKTRSINFENSLIFFSLILICFALSHDLLYVKCFLCFHCVLWRFFIIRFLGMKYHVIFRPSCFSVENSITITTKMFDYLVNELVVGTEWRKSCLEVGCLGLNWKLHFVKKALAFINLSQ